MDSWVVGKKFEPNSNGMMVQHITFNGNESFQSCFRNQCNAHIVYVMTWPSSLTTDPSYIKWFHFICPESNTSNVFALFNSIWMVYDSVFSVATTAFGVPCAQKQNHFISSFLCLFTSVNKMNWNLLNCLSKRRY